MPVTVATYNRPSGPHAAWVGAVTVATTWELNAMGLVPARYVKLSALLTPLGVWTRTVTVPVPVEPSA